MRRSLLLLICFISLLCQAKTWTLSGLPNPQLDDRTKTLVDPDNIVSYKMANDIDSMVAITRRKTTCEVVPVIVDNINDKDTDEFATKLFRRWGIGKKDNNNGVLVLVVVDQRKVVIRTGYGAEKVLPDIVAGRIVTEYMIPRFLQQKYGLGLAAGVLEICKIMIEPETAQELTSSQEEFGGDWLSRHKEQKVREFENDNRFKKFDFFKVYLMISCIVAVLMMLVLGSVLISLRKKTDHQRYVRLKHFAFPFMALTVLFMFIPIPAPIFIYYLLNKWRNHPRNCPDCGNAMQRLDEDEDNKHLSPSQDLEEELKSVDYDVWLCPDCGKTLVYNFVMDSDYTQCPKCHARTFKLTESRMITEPTPHKSGKGEKVYTCASCNYQKIRPFYMARKYNDKRAFLDILKAPFEIIKELAVEEDLRVCIPLLLSLLLIPILLFVFIPSGGLFGGGATGGSGVCIGW